MADPTVVVAGPARLYLREVGKGEPIVVLHRGPDFDHRYLLPDLDRLSDSFHLVYYDQRGRGLSADGVQPEDVTLDGEIEDLDAVRRHVGAASIALLGHSWGALLALEYAIRHPERVSRLVLMNPAPASQADHRWLASESRRTHATDLEQLKAMAAGAGYREGDPDAVAAYYRVHFRRAVQRHEDLDRVVASLRASFTREGILKARAIEDRLMEETWGSSEGYDLLPRLGALGVPALLICGEHEIVPLACVEHIAQALPGARLVTLAGCGHFAYLESPDATGRAIRDFFGVVRP